MSLKLKPSTMNVFDSDRTEHELSILVGDKEQALQEISTSKNNAINNINASKTSAVNEINTTKDAAKAEVQSVVDSIPEDYTVFEHETRTNIAELQDIKANKDGYYESMSVGLAENLISPDGVVDEEPYLYRTTAGSQSVTDGYADLRSVKGNTLVWNQLAKKFNGDTYSFQGITYTYNSDGTYTMNGTTGSNTSYYIVKYASSADYNHWYFIGGRDRNEGDYGYGDSQGYGTKYSYIEKGHRNITVGVHPNTTVNNVKTGVATCVDLTKMFGVGNEPTSTNDPRIKWLESELEKHPEYNEGELINVNPFALKTVGFNQWDEEWLNGYYAYGTFLNEQCICSKNLIPVIPNATYKLDTKTVNNYYISYYDVNKNYIANHQRYSSVGREVLYSNAHFTVPSNAYYVHFNIGSTYGIEYKNDISFHLEWSGYRNGEYEPYWSQTKQLPNIKEIKDADGNQLFPYGLLSAGDVRDEITPTKAIKRVKAVDLSTLHWRIDSDNIFYTYDIKFISRDIQAICSRYPYGNNNDKSWFFSGTNYFEIKDTSYATENDFKQSLTGVMLYYPLGTSILIQESPIEVEFDEPYNLSYRESDFGTEEFLYNDGEIAVPVAHETFYMSNLRDEVRRLPNNYQSQDSMNNLLSSLGQALGMTINATWDESSKSYRYTFTPNASTLSVEEAVDGNN